MMSHILNPVCSPPIRRAALPVRDLLCEAPVQTTSPNLPPPMLSHHSNCNQSILYPDILGTSLPNIPSTLPNSTASSSTTSLSSIPSASYQFPREEGLHEIHTSNCNYATPKLPPNSSPSYQLPLSSKSQQRMKPKRSLYYTASSPPASRGPWRATEDRILSELVVRFGPCNWSSIAAFLPHRSGKQARERWLNQLNPTVKKKNWAPCEDRIILSEHSKIGNRWSTIAPLLNGRTDNAVKNRFNSTLKRALRECVDRMVIHLSAQDIDTGSYSLTAQQIDHVLESIHPDYKSTSLLKMRLTT